MSFLGALFVGNMKSLCPVRVGYYVAQRQYQQHELVISGGHEKLPFQTILLKKLLVSWQCGVFM